MDGMGTRDADLNIAAEVRAVEEGHHALLDGRIVRVKSDTTLDLYWEVEAKVTHPGAGIVFHCVPTIPGEGHGERWSRAPGRLPCKHAALAVRRLERDGLARFGDDGLWVATDLVPTREVDEPATDPFAGFPRSA